MSEEENCVFSKPKFARRNRRQNGALSSAAESEAVREVVGGEDLSALDTDLQIFRPPERKKMSGAGVKSKGSEGGGANIHVDMSLYTASTATEEKVGTTEGDVTKGLRLEAEEQKEQREREEREARDRKRVRESGGEIYLGMKAVVDYMPGSEPKSGYAKGVGLRAGPVKVSGTLRNTYSVDYQPVLCKDYKETGYCGWGDNCKFLHDRTDYKSGWQIDKEWEEAKASGKPMPSESEQTFGGVPRWRQDLLDEKKRKEEEAELVEKDDYGVPFACLKCRQKWGPERTAVILTCKHIFCEKCIVEWFKKSSKCPYCKQATGKIYNTPKELLKRIDMHRRRAEEMSRRDDLDPNGDKSKDIRLDDFRKRP